MWILGPVILVALVIGQVVSMSRIKKQEKRIKELEASTGVSKKGLEENSSISKK